MSITSRNLSIYQWLAISQSEAPVSLASIASKNQSHYSNHLDDDDDDDDAVVEYHSNASSGSLAADWAVGRGAAGIRVKLFV